MREERRPPDGLGNMDATRKRRNLEEFLDLESATVMMGEPDDLEFLEECFELFRTRAEREVGLYSEWVRSGKSDDIKKSAHALKSASAAIGAIRISRLFAEIETVPQPERCTAIQDEFGRLSSLWKTYQEANRS